MVKEKLPTVIKFSTLKYNPKKESALRNFKLKQLSRVVKTASWIAWQHEKLLSKK